MNTEWMIFILISTITVVFSEHSQCPSTHWGPPDCINHCHCESGDVACRESDGHCLSGICGQGWTGMPSCQTPCDDGTFGTNCMYLCHCPAGDACSIYNGLCSSGKCGRGWAGPSCQTRLPELRDPVVIGAITNTSMMTSWRHWDPETDEGVGPVVYYVLEYQAEGEVEWHNVITLLESSTTRKFLHEVSGLQKDTAYRFRIVLGYVMEEKWVISVPGLPSRYVRTTGGSIRPRTTTTTRRPGVTDSFSSSSASPEVSLPTPLPPRTPKPNLPEKPVAIHLRFRNQSMLRVEWRLTSHLYKWCWKRYRVELKRLVEETRKRSATEQILETSETKATFTGLDPSSQYQLTVKSIPEQGVIPFEATYRTWTLPTYMRAPRRPKFVNATEKTLGVFLYGVSSYEADIKSYQVVVENLSANKLFNITTLAAAVSAGLTLDAAVFYAYEHRKRNREHPNAYITARLHRDDLDPDGTAFTIGDDSTYGSFENVPLTKTSEYAVWSVASYNYKGTIVSQMARSKSSYVPGKLLAQPVKQSMQTGYIIAIIVAVLLLLVAIAVVFALVWKRHSEKMKYFNKFTLFRRTQVPSKYEQSTQIAESPHPPSKYKPRRSLYEELDFESSGPPIHVPRAQGVLTNPSYVALRNSNAIRVDKLKQYCMERDSTDFSIAEEFRHLPIGLIDTVHAATKPNNALLNRTSHILPYDSNRIKVKSIEPSGEGHDYINASLVKTHLHTFYVVTQCPMNTTMGEFWRMVWEQEVSVIVALLAMDEPDKPEYKAYWPKIDDHPLLYHDVRVSCNGSERSAHYVIRTFYISRLVEEREQIRVVRHYQYVSWTKAGIPKFTAPFLDFLDRITEGQKKNPKTILVHCHSGGGRSGMFVAIDSLIKEGQQKGQVDVLKCVTKLRQERPNMVKHLKQYKFIYEALVDFFLCTDSAADAPAFRQKYEAMNSVNKNVNNSRPQLALEFEAIEFFKNLPSSPQKNSILKDPDQPFVSPVKKSTSFRIDNEIVCPNEDQSLVTAFVDSFSAIDAFIVIKHPDDRQVDEFWRVVAGNNCSAIVSLNSTDDGSEPAQFVPDTFEKPCRETYGTHVVTVSEEPLVSDSCVTTEAMVYPKSNPENSQTLKSFDFTNWLSHSDVPSVKHMLGFIQQVRESKCEREGPVVVQSNRGCDRAMIFCLLWTVFERIDLEGKVNMFRAVLHHRKFVPTTIYNASQYRFIYQCVNDYISERPSCMDITTLNDIHIHEDPSLYHQLMLHSQSQSLSLLHSTTLPNQDSPEKKGPSPTPSQLSARVNQEALNKTIEDLSTWFSKKPDQTVLERSHDQTIDMPDLEEEDFEKERQKNFDGKLLDLFQVK